MLAKAKHTVSAYQRETVPFLGLNRSDDTREGEFSGQKNMSDRRYPFLTPRLPRSAEKFETEPGALFSWDGAQITVQDGKLLYNGEPLCNVTDGEKQFAVVNTKLVVWPDKLAVDLTNKEVTGVSAQAANKSTATFTPNSLSFPFKTKYASTTFRYRWTSGQLPYLYTYSSVSWNEETREWSKEGGGWTMPSEAEGRMYIPDVSYSENTMTYTVNQPACQFANSTPSGHPSDEPSNDLGFYVVLDECISGGEAPYHKAEIRASVYWAKTENQSFADLFVVGDVLSVSGTKCGYMDVDRASVKEVNAETNTLTFEADVFPSGDAIVEGAVSKGWYIARYKADPSSDKYTKFCVQEINGTAYADFTMSKEQYAVINGSAKRLCVYEKVNGKSKIVANYKVESTTDNASTSAGIHWLNMSALSYAAEPVTVTRDVPDLDYICERENRLCGVSNKDDTIYISALGDPTNFYDYSGDKGSFSVAVGSEGEFTGICDYGNALLCWKERTLHKVLGDYPSNYQTATYRFSGVRAGGHKSLVNVNETLFFLGVDGVCAYSGNKPSLISRTLGTDVLKNGVGGTDGKVYYLSVENGEEWELLSYDTHTGLWFRSDETQVVDFCRVGDDVKFLSGDTVYTIGGGDEQVEWETVFVPMYETLEGGKQYNRLIFRVEVPKDGYIAADVRFDSGRWMQAGIVKGKSGSVSLPVPLRRCDKFEIRLRGKGDCAVLDMVREFRLRGDG